MPKYLVEIEVDEEALRNSDGEVSDVDNADDDIEYLIEREMGWVQASGISLVKIIKKLDE